MIRLFKISFFTGLLCLVAIPAMAGKSGKEIAAALPTFEEMSKIHLPSDDGQEDDGPGVFIHLVQPGETIATLGKLYGVDPDQIRRANFLISDARYPVAGDKIVIP